MDEPNKKIDGAASNLIGDKPQMNEQNDVVYYYIVLGGMRGGVDKGQTTISELESISRMSEDDLADWKSENFELACAFNAGLVDGAAKAVEDLKSSGVHTDYGSGGDCAVGFAFNKRDAKLAALDLLNVTKDDW